jgi:hypothetical protein
MASASQLRTLNRLRAEALGALPLASILQSFKSLKEHRREQSQRDTRARTSGHVYREWTAPVDALAEHAREEQRRLQDTDYIVSQLPWSRSDRRGRRGRDVSA